MNDFRSIYQQKCKLKFLLVTIEIFSRIITEVDYFIGNSFSPFVQFRFSQTAKLTLNSKTLMIDAATKKPIYNICKAFK
jgi:hypothetical protein